MINLNKYPRLHRYLEKHKQEIADRHCARKSPVNWYRTIDKIDSSLKTTPKFLIPDIKGEANIVYDSGSFYPHHNLYYITSEEWDLKALQVVLCSGMARLFVAAYSTRMRGGYLRFQAQYLRRIRIPKWQDIPNAVKNELRAAAGATDLAARNRAVRLLYGLSEEECTAIGLNQEQLYTTASVIASPREAISHGSYSDLSEMTSLKTFVTSFAGHIASEAART